jgi:hypothetical protein
MNELQPIHETESENAAKGVPGTGTLGTAKVARENEIPLNNKGEKAKEPGMSDWQKLGIEKIKELQANGELRSSAEKFLDEPTIGRAVRRFCYECNGFSNQHATNCESSNCALWLFRHGKITANEDELPVWQKAHKRWLQSAGELKCE